MNHNNPAASVLASLLAQAFVGWVERSDTHRSPANTAMGIALLNPSYGQTQEPAV